MTVKADKLGSWGVVRRLIVQERLLFELDIAATVFSMGSNRLLNPYWWARDIPCEIPDGSRRRPVRDERLMSCDVELSS